jgi:hypothetical protein
VLYLAPDHAAPSWGVGLLYEHVRLLREAGVEAAVLHHRHPFRVEWLESDAAVTHLDREEPAADDLLIVPEVLAWEAARRAWRCARGVFVQGSFLVLSGAPRAFRYPELGYELALAVLPHVAAVVERQMGLPAAVVPPFVADYFFRSGEQIAAVERERVALVVCKPEYRHAGYPDWQLCVALLERAFAERWSGWRLETLDGLTHRQVAERMATASLLVNLNSHEAFNSTVPEAAAAGCVAACYDAVGGSDFLVDGEDGLVVANHRVFELVERVERAIEAQERRDPALLELRLRARARAERFRAERTRAALLAALAPALSGDAR